MRPSERMDEMEIQIAARFAAQQIILMMIASSLFRHEGDAAATRRKIAEFDAAVAEQITPNLFGGLDGKERRRAAEFARAYASEMIGGLIVSD
jgi:hypothetical protein